MPPCLRTSPPLGGTLEVHRTSWRILFPRHACMVWYWGSEALGCRTLRLESQSSARLRMQPYPWAPDLVWPGHLHGTGCLSARAMDTGFPTVVWRLCLGPGCAGVWVLVTPPALVGVSGGCVWVRFGVSPLFSPLGFAVFAVGFGFRPAPHLSWLGFRDVLCCVRAAPAPSRSRFCCVVWACVLGSGFRLRPASPWGGVGVCVCLCARPAWFPAPPGWGCGAGVCGRAWVAATRRHSWLGCCGVCVCVCAPLVPRFSWLGCAVWACVLGSGFGCAPSLLVGLLGCACGPLCAPLAPAPPGGPLVARGCAGVPVGGVCPPPLPFGFVFSWLCGVGRWLYRSWVSWSLSPHPFSSGPRCLLFVCFLASRPGVCPRVLGVPSPGGPLPSAWCCRFWLGGPPAPLWGVPSSVPSGWGFGRLLWCWWAAWWLWAVLAPPPPPLFFFWYGGVAPGGRWGMEVERPVAAIYTLVLLMHGKLWPGGVE